MTYWADDHFELDDRGVERCSIRFEWDPDRWRWRMVMLDTGEISECESLSVLLDHFHRQVMGPDRASLFLRLAMDIDRYADDHAECDA